MGRQGDDSKWPHGGAIDAAKSFGADMVEKDVGDVCVDTMNKIVTTPAFMYNGKFHEIQDGVGNMIKELLKMLK
jgi:enhancing lycopene biosynthesis protein 2